jgi:hypothetical protein
LPIHDDDFTARNDGAADTDGDHGPTDDDRLTNAIRDAIRDPVTVRDAVRVAVRDAIAAAIRDRVASAVAGAIRDGQPHHLPARILTAEDRRRIEQDWRLPWETGIHRGA